MEVNLLKASYFRSSGLLYCSITQTEYRLTPTKPSVCPSLLQPKTAPSNRSRLHQLYPLQAVRFQGQATLVAISAVSPE